MNEGRSRDAVRRIAERHMVRLSRLDRIEKELARLVEELEAGGPEAGAFARRLREMLDESP